MRAWFRLLGGLLAWAAHFLGAYAIASLSDFPSIPVWMIHAAIVALSLVCFATCAVVLWICVKRRRDGWIDDVGATGAIVAGIAVVFQTVPFVSLPLA